MCCLDRVYEVAFVALALLLSLLVSGKNDGRKRLQHMANHFF